ncbi:putative germin-like protein 2-1 [Dioscorea cayenensis subsp. rotundata]|uniref:Germin-like protein n=1 Tax=Dioscorea cayennensis subsp. rotundata TaxID=55577 RepID=A0AB40D1K4_DIOCR|nr:putative germin-like protein 2-1 [Dioscorea cayenensis subsp. rotundata]
MATSYVLLLSLLALAFSHSLASDPSPLQDFCVADLKSTVLVNGFVCKSPQVVSADDFTFHGLDMPGNTSNPQGSAVTPVFVQQLPGLNTLGVSLARLDFAPYGLIPPHYHPRGTEIMTVIEGTLHVGFVTSFPNFQLFTQVVKKGDVFVFPQGLIHFQFNYGDTPAVAISGLGSQDPGVVLIPNAVFGSNPPINDAILAKAFQLDVKIIDYLQSKF